MSLEVLREVRRANKRHAETDDEHQTRLSEISAETPNAPVGASGVGRDTKTSGVKQSR